ncbi:MAG TPA: crossover junction endodeoxyribonuclease RuvC [Eoetvoesiella sp.]|jgi:crossover junction endodeoxyribonuclease RuvC|uniref:crossover junction endodeoxyribonuclease RuvC n=1 Tax=Eoetvoesiella sp. TaxID=1966355 RepID=UPI002B85EB4D|nr:crossover junction endodeoxyribonuclease RuvC [Eoetvoesiella sp.]HWK60507.1 crossover junction endodeoxyribonuclease RuvC [Eoetvoesiella sp.]
MRILGVDPGLRRTGFGVVDAQGMRLQYVTSGTIVVPSDLPLAERLKVILDNIREVVETTSPTVSALEKVFVNANPSSTLLLGQARGAAMCALADSRLQVHEYTALQIKKSVVGNGHAAKEQVQRMVQHLLSLDGLPAADSADALACAICHAHVGPMVDRLAQRGQLPGTKSVRLRGGRLTR